MAVQAISQGLGKSRTNRRSEKPEKPMARRKSANHRIERQCTPGQSQLVRDSETTSTISGKVLLCRGNCLCDRHKKARHKQHGKLQHCTSAFSFGGSRA